MLYKNQLTNEKTQRKFCRKNASQDNTLVIRLDAQKKLLNYDELKKIS